MYVTVKDKRVPRWKQHEIWNDAGKVLIAVVLCLFVFTVIYLHVELHGREEWYSASPADRPFSDLMLTPKEHVTLREILCRRHQEHCYYVTEVAVHSGRVLRRLQMEPYSQTIISASYVKQDGGVKADLLFANYVRLAMQAPYLFNSTAFPPKKQRALQIGLGAGSSAAFLEHLGYEVESIEYDPMIIHIARKWFKIPMTPQHRVILGDGVRFVMERSPLEPQYNFAFIDACYADEVHLFTCPIEIFFAAEFVRNLRRHMAPDCAIAMNTYLRHNDLEKLLEGERLRHAALVLYRKYFGTCTYVENDMNSVMLCSCKRRPKVTQDSYDEFLWKMPAGLSDMLSVDGQVRDDW